MKFCVGGNQLGSGEQTLFYESDSTVSIIIVLKLDLDEDYSNKALIYGRVWFKIIDGIRNKGIQVTK